MQNTHIVISMVIHYCS